LMRIRVNEPNRFVQINNSKGMRDTWLNEWQVNATMLLKAVAMELPSASLFWRLHSYPGPLPNGFTGPTAGLPDHMVKAINSAASDSVLSGHASSLAKVGNVNIGRRLNVQLIDLPKKFPELQRVNSRDCLHPVDEVSVCAADNLLETLLPGIDVADVGKSCRAARSARNECVPPNKR